MKNNQELLNEYLLSIVVEKGLSKNTLLAYKNDLTFFLNYLKENNTFILDIDHYQVNEYIEYLQDNKLAIKSIKRKVSALKNFFIYLTLHENFKYDFSYFESLKEEEYLPKFVLQEDMNRVLDSLKTDTFIEIRNKAICELMYATGIRVSELVGLNVEDFDFSQNAFKVTRKGGNQTILYYPNEVKYALEEWLTIRETLPIDKEEKALFLSLQNKRICTRAVENIVKKFAYESSPLKKITPHKLRSTFGTNLYRETNDIYIVADVLGHKDVNTTKKHYAAISDDLRRNVAKKVKIGYDE